jgi:carboxyl-terminal processing protease
MKFPYFFRHSFRYALVLTACGYVLSGLQLVQAAQPTADPKAEVSPSSAALPLQQIQRFTNAIGAIKEYYVEPVKDDKLFSSAIRGMLSGLDPHSAYLDAQDLKELQDITLGEFGGIGLEVLPENGGLRIISPLDGSPGQKAGLKPGDLIVRVDQVSVKGMSSPINKMRGKPGTKVSLTILRKGVQEPLVVTITRQIIKLKSVKNQLLDQQYGYIRISNFQAGTETDLKAAVATLKRQAGNKLKGVVLDLRNNPGGLLEPSIEVSNLFLDSKKLQYDRLIVYAKGRFPASQFQAKATSYDLLQGIPLVVLINEASASGAEIVAGALQDQKRAVVMGTNSFGKGSVQTVLPLDNQSALKLTTAIYYTPAGRSIQAKGIKPDIIVAELKMSDLKKTNKPWIELKEADLEGHLENASGEDDTADAAAAASTSDKKDKVPEGGIEQLPSPKTDYQLNEALNLLKGLNAISAVQAQKVAR